MSNVINFSIEINNRPEGKNVALKTIMLIAAMAEVSMRDMVNCIDGIEDMEVADPKVDIPKIATVEEVEEGTERPKRKRASRAKAAKVEETETEEVETEEVKEKPAKAGKKEREDSAVDAYEKKKASKVEETEEVDVTVEDLRKLLKDVVHANREGIKNKLSDLGADSLSTLDEEKYGAMYKYLNSLK